MRDGFGLGDVYLRNWPGLNTAERARVALRVLVDAGWLRARRAAAASRGGEQYMVNPAIFTDSTEVPQSIPADEF